MIYLFKPRGLANKIICHKNVWINVQEFHQILCAGIQCFVVFPLNALRLKILEQLSMG